MKRYTLMVGTTTYNLGTMSKAIERLIILRMEASEANEPMPRATLVRT